MKGLFSTHPPCSTGKDPPGYELVISPGSPTNSRGRAWATGWRCCSRHASGCSRRRSAPRTGSGRRPRSTGDSRRLSETDIEVLALALELGYQIVTDDYSIQNLATVLGVPFRGLDQKGIGAVFEWEARCKGCGKRFPAAVKECDICGSETRTARKRKGGR